jgi:hypothetical protein
MFFIVTFSLSLRRLASIVLVDVWDLLRGFKTIKLEQVRQSTNVSSLRSLLTTSPQS